MVLYLSNPMNLEKWGISDFGINRLQHDDGTWKTYGEIAEIVDELEEQIDNE